MLAVGKVLSRGQVTLPRAVRRVAGLEPGDLVTFHTTSPGVVEIKALPRLRLAEALERYQITGPIDEAAARAEWQARAAEDVLGRADG
jgi:bifunctional DNA-binding transcriptional regulator/antitoxin component of YhaV-PrlF toxin-antitoxin module